MKTLLIFTTLIFLFFNYLLENTDGESEYDSEKYISEDAKKVTPIEKGRRDQSR